MTIEEKVKELLTAASAVTDSVPADRIKPPGDWQALARPYIVHFPVAPAPDYTHQGRAALTQWPSYQASVFAADYATARAIAVAVVNALLASSDPKFFWRGQTALPYETDTKVQHIALDFEVWEAL
jgi:hypothetical protein